ncbi:MAG: adenosylhomocysteinase, partial [Pseudomonadota bacterium]
MHPNIVKHPELAEAGAQRIAWVKQNMPILGIIGQRFEKEKPFRGKRVLVCVHLEAKTSYLALLFAQGGAEVVVTGSNPDSTKDDVVAALDQAGLHVYAAHGASHDDMQQYMSYALDLNPNIVIDDGGDVVELLHGERQDVAQHIVGVCEETTTGVLRARARAKAGQLEFPVVLINDAHCKYLFDNYHGTGQSVWDAIMRSTNLSVCGKTVVILGFGWCGQGCADRARGLGANVIVCETDPIKAVAAHLHGYRVMPSLEASLEADFFVTATGSKHVLNAGHFSSMKNGAVIANAGHFHLELDLASLKSLAIQHQQVRDNVTAYKLDDHRSVFLLGGGNIVNIACGDGHPAEIMDTSFALQALSAEYLVSRGQNLSKGVHVVPQTIDQ